MMKKHEADHKRMHVIFIPMAVQIRAADGMSCTGILCSDSSAGFPEEHNFSFFT